MKHHFANLLEDANPYWSISPNAERWKHHFDDLADAPSDTCKLTITRDDAHWQRIFDLSALTELTLHEPNPQQLDALFRLPNLTALRISHARPKSLEMLENLDQLRELVLEYVSGFDDLTPVGHLPALVALHTENLRGASDFSMLGCSKSLRYFAIYGTLDWNQPIESFDFLRDLCSLELLKLGFGVRVPTTTRVFGSLLHHPTLKEVSIGLGTLALENYAWLEAMLPHVTGTVRPAYVRYGGAVKPIHATELRAQMSQGEFLRNSSVFIGSNGKRYEQTPHQAMLLGKGMRIVSGTDEKVDAKCAAHEKKYQALVAQYRAS